MPDAETRLIAALSPAVGGLINLLEVDADDRVMAGQVLVDLDDELAGTG